MSGTQAPPRTPAPGGPLADVRVVDPARWEQLRDPHRKVHV
ncbi:hypothetical protein ACIP88_13015 [Streptomyces uncialis]